MPSLKEEVPFESRVAETHKIRAKYPNRIPVVCEKASRSNLPEIEKKKFLVPMNMLVGEFKFILHQHINQSAYGSNMKLFREKTIYLFVNNIIPKTGLLMQELYEMYKDEDGYLYLDTLALGALVEVKMDVQEDVIVRPRIFFLKSKF
ncbi:autophagy-related protein 8, putative (ATG8) [Plasmodium ovale curtisi]|uniref:Autophagy-related protein n=1 Tax=Plasmodium ovale curtisi TaxID=864141 RepID=A0A1A8X6G9_PLAOA|nr:autophagy-related protein 8, putative (ATG8) [Plasmodium ovale curtisi]SBT00213.1 autophagy-related protein 8, putative (ATG8) [Plasmodium ovale curtisi]